MCAKLMHISSGEGTPAAAITHTLTLVRVARIQSPPHAGEEPSCNAAGSAQWLSENFLENLNICLADGSVITLLGISPKKLKTSAHTEICSWMFVDTFSTIARTWERWSKWVNKLWSIQSDEMLFIAKKSWPSQAWNTWRKLKWARCGLIHR